MVVVHQTQLDIGFVSPFAHFGLKSVVSPPCFQGDTGLPIYTSCHFFHYRCLWNVRCVGNLFDTSPFSCPQQENSNFLPNSGQILIDLGALDSHSRAGGHCVARLTCHVCFSFCSIHITHCWHVPEQNTSHVRKINSNSI
jgi:hypothetical protein